MREIVQQGHCLLTFPTVVYQKMVSDTEWLKSLAALARTLSRREPSIAVSQAGGWHSDGNVFERFAEEVVPLRHAIDDALREIWEVVGFSQAASYGLQGWLNVLGMGGYHRCHQHARAAWAGVLYAEAAAGASELELMDPRPPTFAARSNDRVCVAVRTGLLVMFPGSTWHAVAPHGATQPRVTLAFNVYVESDNLCTL